MATLNLNGLKKISLMSVTLLITACSTNVANNPVENVVLEATPEVVVAKSRFHTHNLVSDYTDRLAHYLMQGVSTQQLNNGVKISTFEFFDSQQIKNSHLALLISESLAAQLQQYNVPVVLPQIALADDNYREAEYVLSGSLISNERGVVVNARITQISSNRVLSFASTLIPSFVVDSI